MGKYLYILLLLCVSHYLFSQKIEPIDNYINSLGSLKPIVTKAGNPVEIDYEGTLHLYNSTSDQIFLNLNKSLEKPDKYEVLYTLKNYFLSPDSIFNSMKASKRAFVKPAVYQSIPPRFKDNAIVNVKYYDIEQGLSNSYIYDLYEDKNRMIWIATNGGGVNRFDGDQFIIYTEAEGLANNMVKSIACDHNGNLWFGTVNGISVFNGSYFANYTVENGLTDNHINDLFIDSKNRVWVATRNGGINIIENNSIKVFHSSIAISDHINVVEEDANGNIWIGTKNGVYKVNDSLIYHFKTTNGLIDNQVFSIEASTENNNVYVGTNKGLSLIRNDSVFQFGEKNALLETRINEILDDGENGIFIGTNGDGLIRLAKTGMIRLNEGHGLSNSEIQTIYRDRSNVYWMGTWGGGINRYDGFKFLHFNKNQGLPTNIFPAIREDGNGELWLGSFGSGILKYSKGSFFQYYKKQGFLGDAVWSIIFDNYGNMWAATDSKGIWRYDGSNYYNYQIKNGFIDNSTWSLLNDSNEDIWIGTATHGLVRFDGIEWKLYSFTENPIISLYEDRKGNIWALTWGDGVYMLSGKSISHFSGNTDFPADKVYNMYEDKEGYLWFATSGSGLVIYNGNSFQTIQKSDGISSNIIYWIKELNEGNILIGTESGLTEFILAETKESKYPQTGFLDTQLDSLTLEKKIFLDGRKFSIHTYGIIEGFTGHDCIGSQHSAVFTKDGSVWIGTGNQLTKYTPQNNRSLNVAGKVQLKSVQVSLHELDWVEYSSEKSQKEKQKMGIVFDSIDPMYNIPQNLNLSYKHNQINFQFVAIDWKNPQKVYYKYKLEGLNNEWSYPTKNSDAMFTNLKPGNYTLKVKVINSSLKWSDPLIYSFTIETPWWQTIIARISFIISFVISLLAYIRWRISSLRKQKIMLERIVSERTQEIYTQKEEILAQRDALNETNIHLERLSIVARETDNGVLIADYRGNIEWINEGYTKLLGYNLDDLREVKGINLFFIYKSLNTLEFFKKCKDERIPVTFSSIYERADNTEKWLQTTVTPIFDAEGELKKYVVIYADITDLKLAQNQVERHIKEIQASIRYASRIQNSILPNHSIIDQSNLDNFILYKPKDIVGGDFYWFSTHGQNHLAGVVDCTGHGVPGALMSVVAYAAMRKVVTNVSAKNPASLLQLINHEVRTMLKKEENRSNISDDGLDISLCYIMPEERKVIFAGAKQSLFHCWSNEIDEIKGDRQSIGYADSTESFKYTNHEIEVRYRSTFYLSSDGFKDMPVNTDGQLLGKKNFRNLLGSISIKPMDEQEAYLQNIIRHSSGHHVNYDDITIFSFRMKE
jgi:PAS domain S-box-containing protein